MMTSGQIVILNGAPRSGKSSIVRAIQSSADVPWMNLGGDTSLSSNEDCAARILQRLGADGSFGEAFARLAMSAPG